MRDMLRAGIGLRGKRSRDRGIVGLGLVLVELEAALDLFNRHLETHNRFLQRFQPPGRHLDDSHGFFGSSRSSNLALSVSICSASSSSDIARTGPVRCTAW